MALSGRERFLSAALGPPIAHKTCMFVNSPDEHFIIDVLPEERNLVVAAGFSGHGYTFCSGIGEILADLATFGATAHDTHPFRLSRPAMMRS
jgi:sarcosine oxidase